MDFLGIRFCDAEFPSTRANEFVMNNFELQSISISCGTHLNSGNLNEIYGKGEKDDEFYISAAIYALMKKIYKM